MIKIIRLGKEYNGGKGKEQEKGGKKDGVRKLEKEKKIDTDNVSRLTSAGSGSATPTTPYRDSNLLDRKQLDMVMMSKKGERRKVRKKKDTKKGINEEEREKKKKKKKKRKETTTRKRNCREEKKETRHHIAIQRHTHPIRAHIWLPARCWERRRRGRKERKKRRERREKREMSTLFPLHRRHFPFSLLLPPSLPSFLRRRSCWSAAPAPLCPTCTRPRRAPRITPPPPRPPPAVEEAGAAAVAATVAGAVVLGTAAP